GRSAGSAVGTWVHRNVKKKIAVTEQAREGRSPSATLGGYVRADFPPPTASHGNGDSRSKPAPQS
ncbi:hypothetical protein U1Q18_042802, partial [Sarracenia purpurea var. burkii]